MAPLVFIFAVLAASASTEPSPRTRSSMATTIDRWPSIVQVEFRQPYHTWTHTCAANILRSTFVLSVAHCFNGSHYDPANRRIRAGSSFSEAFGVVRYVLKEYNHPSYGIRGMDGDISVVRLYSALVYTPEVQQGIFISQGVEVPAALAVWHVGWAHIVRQQRVNSGVLLETQIYTVNNAFCAERYASSIPPTLVTENMICAGRPVVGDGNEGNLCDGDSGSPLYFPDPTQGNIIIGLASFGAGCSNYSFPGVNTAVSPYTNWIIATAV